MCSPAELAWIKDGLQQGVRNDGRSEDDYRSIALQTGLLKQASGSAKLCLGGTDVLVGIKVELGTPSQDRPSCGTVQVAVECSPCADPRFKGRGGDELASQYATALQRMMQPGPSGQGGGLDLTALCVTQGKVCWQVFVDALVLNADGNVLDALSMATWAALADTRIPAVEVAVGEGDEEAEIEVDDDPSKAAKLDVSAVPVMVTVSLLGEVLAVDLDSTEELCSKCSLSVAVNQSGKVFGTTQQGTSGLPVGYLQEMLHKASQTGPVLLKALKAFTA
jgi:exosome complex component RRP42